MDYEEEAENYVVDTLFSLRKRIKELEIELHNYRIQAQCNDCSALTIIALGNKVCKARCRIKELEVELEKHRWIPVNESLPKEGKCLVLCEGKIYEVKVRISEDEWEDNKGKSSMHETAHCYVSGLGDVLIGHDECITHWKKL